MAFLQKSFQCLPGLKEKLGNSVEIIYEQAINFTNDTMLVYEDVTDRYTWQGNKGFRPNIITTVNWRHSRSCKKLKIRSITFGRKVKMLWMA